MVDRQARPHVLDRCRHHARRNHVTTTFLSGARRGSLGTGGLLTCEIRPNRSTVTVNARLPTVNRNRAHGVSSRAAHHGFDLTRRRG
jgi:hypothetical protein